MADAMGTKRWEEKWAGGSGSWERRVERSAIQLLQELRSTDPTGIKVRFTRSY
jgi:hypothetical protein